MSLYGYKKKGKPALWTQLPSAKAAATLAEKKELAQAALAKAATVHKWKRIAPVSKKRQADGKVYRKAAAEFVSAAVARGERCPVVAAVPELREGFRYGHPISDKLNEVHHMRGRDGALYLAQEFWLAVSKQGHRWIHQNMDKARALGFLCALGDWGRQP